MATLSSCDSCFRPVPSALATHKLVAPDRSDRNANCVPSGEKTGLRSNAMPVSTGRAVPPAASSA